MTSADLRVIKNYYGIPGYLIWAKDIPVEIFKKYPTLWMAKTMYSDDRRWKTPHLFLRDIFISDRYLPDYCDVTMCCQGGLSREECAKDPEKTRFMSMAWIPCEVLDNYLPPARNEWGEVSP